MTDRVGVATENSEDPDRAVVPSWVRYSGIVIILASLLDLFTNFVVVAVFPEAFIPGTRDAVIAGTFVLSYLILGIIGVVALYVYYTDSFGWIGKGGLLSIAIGAGIGVVTIITTGDIGGNFLNFFLVLFVGAGLLAVGLRRIPSIPWSPWLRSSASSDLACHRRGSWARSGSWY